MTYRWVFLSVVVVIEKQLGGAVLDVDALHVYVKGRGGPEPNSTGSGPSGS